MSERLKAEIWLSDCKNNDNGGPLFDMNDLETEFPNIAVTQPCKMLLNLRKMYILLRKNRVLCAFFKILNVFT